MPDSLYLTLLTHVSLTARRLLGDLASCWTAATPLCPPSTSYFNVEHLVRDPASGAPLPAYAYKTLRRHDALRTSSRTNKPSSKADIPPYYAGLLIARAQAMAENSYVEPNGVSKNWPFHYVRAKPITPSYLVARRF
jgi:hypothetical protein